MVDTGRGRRIPNSGACRRFYAEEPAVTWPPEASRPPNRPGGAPASSRFWRTSAILAVLSGFTTILSGCTGSPATLAIRPDFDMATPAGVVSVSIRQALPGMPDDEFRGVVMTGMERGCSCAVIAGRPTEPYPHRRVVWHVNATATPGMSSLVVNVFDGSVPYAYTQEAVPTGVEPPALIDTIAAMTRQLQTPLGRPHPT
jgi:hypothetical protein